MPPTLAENDTIMLQDCINNSIDTLVKSINALKASGNCHTYSIALLGAQVARLRALEGKVLQSLPTPTTPVQPRMVEKRGP